MTVCRPTTTTPSLTRGPLSTIWDQGGPVRPPNSNTHPWMAIFSLASLIKGNNWKPQPKTPPTPSYPNPSNPISHKGSHINHLGQGGPCQTPQTAIHTHAMEKIQ